MTLYRADYSPDGGVWTIVADGEGGDTLVSTTTLIAADDAIAVRDWMKTVAHDRGEVVDHWGMTSGSAFKVYVATEGEA